MTEVSKNILRLLIYSDIFSYPLKFEEIFYRLNFEGLNECDCLNEIEDLINSKFVYEIDGYYLLENSYENVQRRITANTKACHMMIKARKNARIISSFPFIRAVFLSGSISKGDIDTQADIDYFIITAKNRLWFARTLLILYKKIFLFNSYKYFCLNYFIDQGNYTIEERNLFTATEIASLIPLFGSDEFHFFKDANLWVRSYFPHFPIAAAEEPINYKPAKFKTFIETLFNNSFGDLIDNLFMKITIFVLNRRIKKLSNVTAEEAFSEINFNKNCCKYHRNSFQRKILHAYKLKLDEFEQLHNYSLN